MHLYIQKKDKGIIIFSLCIRKSRCSLDMCKNLHANEKAGKLITEHFKTKGSRNNIPHKQATSIEKVPTNNRAIKMHLTPTKNEHAWLFSHSTLICAKGYNNVRRREKSLCINFAAGDILRKVGLKFL
jgi:hypothetical protein